jgi:hypothetical protein
MEEDYESKQLAKCFLTSLSSSILIPDDILQTLQPLGKNLVAVIPGDSKKISFFLTDALQILFVRLFLDKESLDDSFFTSLRLKLTELGMTNLFSTGVCFKNDICVWEGVFEYDDDSNQEEVETKLAEVNHVKKTKFEKIQLND